MKRLLVLFMLLLAVSGCAAGGDKYSGRFDREACLPDSAVSELAGVPMKLAYDRRNIAEGYLGWAWEETQGMPKLLTVEIRFPPADCEQMYADAVEKSDAIHAPGGMQACNDDRAVHAIAGDYYIRLVCLGISNEDEMIGKVMDRLAATIQSK